MMMIYRSKIEKVKFDKNVNIPIPGTLKFIVPRNDVYTNPGLETDTFKLLRKMVYEMRKKEVKEWHTKRQK